MDWAQTTVVVTGATRGIGRAVVEDLTGRGARIGAVARSPYELDALSGELGTEVAVADVAQRSSIEAALAGLGERLGRIDVLVNNAGVGLYGPVRALDVADAERLMQVNYLGTLYATCFVLPAMLGRRRGHIVNVGSIAGRIGSPFEAAYAASKFAVSGFTEALAVELTGTGVSVSLVNPGPVDTSFFAARGHPYERRRPRPVAPTRIAGAVRTAVEHTRLEKTVPAGLGAAVAIRHLVPPLFLAGTRRAFRRELRR